MGEGGRGDGRTGKRFPCGVGSTRRNATPTASKEAIHITRSSHVRIARVTHHQRIPLVLNSLVNHHSPPSFSIHDTSCVLWLRLPGSRFHLPSSSPLPRANRVSMRESFPFEKNRGEKKRKKSVSNSLSIIASLRSEQRPSSFCFSSSSREYIRVNPHLCPSLYIRRGDPFPTYEKVRGVSCFALTTFRFERFSVLDKGIFVSFKSGNCQ